MDNRAIKDAMTIRLDNVLPEYPKFVEGIRRAPDRGFRLTKAQAETAWPDSTTSVWFSVSCSRYFFMSLYWSQFWQTLPVSPYVTSS